MIEDTLEQPPNGTTTFARPLDDRLEQQIQKATQALLAQQRPDGHWVFELEADATIPAEYVLLRHYLGEPVDAALGGRGLSGPAILLIGTAIDTARPVFTSAVARQSSLA